MGDAVLDQMAGHPLPKNSEQDIQNRLYREFNDRGHRPIVPNVPLFAWESDLISVTPAGYVCEYEVKCSRSDFKADFKKDRHKLLGVGIVRSKARGYGPAYFYYVVPRDLVQSSEVPDFAGLIYSHPLMQIVKPAPRLHSVKVTADQRQHLINGLAFRYWKFRLKGKSQ